MDTLLWLIVIGYIVFRLVSMNKLSRRLDALTRSVDKINAHLGLGVPVPVAVPAAEAVAADVLSVPLAAPAEPKNKPAFKSLWDAEKFFGGKLFIWAGGIALALAALFLVQYSIENKLLSPAMQVGLGALFGMVLIAIGVTLNRRYSLIRETLGGAGILALYAACFAGGTVYRLWDPALTLLFMGGVTAACIGLATQVGARIAYISLIGGYVAPLVIGAGAANTLGLFGYLLLLSLALGEIGLRRGWAPLAVWGASGGAFWLLAAVMVRLDEPNLWVYCLFVLISTFWQIAVVARLRSGESRAHYRYINIILITSMLSMVLLCVRAHYDLIVMLTAFLLLAGSVLFQRLRHVGRLSLLITSLGTVFILLFWPSDMTLMPYMYFCVGIMVLYALVSWSALPAWPWSLASSAIALVGYLIAYAKWSSYGLEILPAEWAVKVYSPTFWTLLAFGMAAVFTGAAALTLRRFGGNWWQAEEAISFFSAAAITFIAVAFAIRLSGEGLVIAWVSEIAALVVLARRISLPALRYCAMALAVVLLLYLLAGLTIGSADEETNLLRILFRYGAPALVFVAAAYVLKDMRPQYHAAFFEVAGPLTILLWFYMSVIALFEGGNASNPANPNWATGLLISAALAVGYLCIRIGRLDARKMLVMAGKIIVSLTLIGLVLSYVLFTNPLWTDIAIGRPAFINALLFIYAIPAFMCALLARPMTGTQESNARFYYYGLGLLLLFMYLVTTVRQLFHGTYIELGATENAERYVQSIAIILAAFAMLLIGLFKDSKSLRIGSLVYMALGTLKVFLWDMNDLQGLWRVVAFIGLGGSLVGIGYIYQRFGLLLDRPKAAR